MDNSLPDGSGVNGVKIIREFEGNNFINIHNSLYSYYCLLQERVKPICNGPSGCKISWIKC